MQLTDSAVKKHAAGDGKVPVTLRLDAELHRRAQQKFRRVGGSFQGILTALLIGYLDGYYELEPELPTPNALGLSITGDERQLLEGVLEIVRNPANEWEKIYVENVLRPLIKVHYDALTAGEPSSGKKP